MHYLETLKKMLCKELEEIAGKGELTAGSLETVHKLTDTIKNIDKIMMLEEDDEGGYSERGGMWDASGVYGDHSYARGRGRYAKRDSRGRYSRDGGYSSEGGYSSDGSYRSGGNSYRGGYSRGEAKEHMVSQLEEMMRSASTEEERRAIQQCMQKIENA